MTTTQITRSQDQDTTTYMATINGQQAAFLTIWTQTREIANVETSRGYQRQGLASQLWQHANDEAECFHSLDHHRTPEGDAFAQAVGGETINDQDGHQPECCICTDSLVDDDDEW